MSDDVATAAAAFEALRFTDVAGMAMKSIGSPEVSPAERHLPYQKKIRTNIFQL